MFIIIKDKYLINKYNLSDYFQYKGIEIYFKNGNYYINLKENYYFSDETKSDLLQLKKYEIHIKDVYYCIELYVYEIDEGIDSFKLYNNQKVLIASSDKANIISHDYYLEKYYLFLADGFIQSNFDISVNGFAYNSEKLNNGDVIELLGIKIIYFEDFLYINNFNVENKLSAYENTEAIVKYPEIVDIPNYYLLSELKDLEIEPIDKFEQVKKNKLGDFIKSLIPNLIMSFSMAALAGVSLYSSILNNQPSYSRLSYILMPISMFMTGIIVPLAFYLYENHRYKKDYKLNKDNYLAYLKQYEDDLESNIKAYLDSYNSRFFDLSNPIDKMFYATKNSGEFLKLSLGKTSTSFDFAYKKTNDTDIDQYLKKLKQRVNHIDDFPLFLDLNENKIVSIVCKTSDKAYFFNKVLLELAYKHHYDDLAIGVYSKDLSLFDRFYNLPHLFINNKRLTLNSDKQLQELNQLKLEKPLVLLINEHLNFSFTNKNIYIIYFSNDIKDLYKDSNCVIEYLNNKGYLYLDKKISFSFVQKDINYNDYYAYLGRLKTINNDYDIHFKDIFSFDIKQNYQMPCRTLATSFATSNNEILSFDLHESKQGPHGLIGGSTGSGKSELIISLLLSLCIRYSPEYLNIVLIDYKGGGIKESLSYNNISIPHIVASVSNLENNKLERLIIALNNECKYRQELFKSLSTKCGVSIMNIDDYLDNGYDKYGLNKIAHLLIVVDEFAQLKKENPEQIKELIAISRIGRSLGLHLILATQKPSGIIDEEITSNSHFKIALKVFDEKDSFDLIKTKDAAYLNNPGSFLLQVDDNTLKAKAIYSKYDINGHDSIKVSLLDNTLEANKTYKYINNKTVSECTYYCKKIIETSDELKPIIRSIDFLPLLSKQRKALTIDKCIVFGESDDYINSKKALVAYSIEESVLVYTGRANEINSFLNTYNEFNRQCVVIANKKYEGTSISDSILYDEQDDLVYLFEYLLKNKNHNLSLIIEDLNCLLSYDESYLDYLCRLARRSKSINLSLLFFTSNTQISYKLINYFNKRILIELSEKGEVSLFYGCRSNYDGKSFYFDNEPILMAPIKIEDYHSGTSKLKPLIKRIPEIIKPSIINGHYLLGYDLYSKEEILANDKLLVLSLDESLLDKYVKAYKGINASIYKHNLKIDADTSILWLGPGIFSQRLFIASNKDDLKADEAIYIHQGYKHIIRSLNYE